MKTFHVKMACRLKIIHIEFCKKQGEREKWSKGRIENSYTRERNLHLEKNTIGPAFSF